jgi:hypothetical protein
MRTPGWRDALRELVTARAHTPFSWGSQDCMLFAADCRLAVTGEDLASPFRGRYRDRKSALCLIKKFGGSDLEAACLKLLGEPNPEGQISAMNGDTVLVEQVPTGKALGVFADEVAVIAGEFGLVELPRQSIISVWRA